MDLRAGSRLSSVVDATEVIVVRPPSVAAVITCGGEPMVAPGDRPPGPPDATSDAPGGEGALLGKRYDDEESGVELLCTKPGSFPLACDGRPLRVKEAKPLPASD